MFKKMRSVHLTYNRQGLVHFTCLDYNNQPPEVQQKINNLCMEVAGEYCQALRDIMIRGKSIRLVAIDEAVAEMTLCRLRKNFYERW